MVGNDQNPDEPDRVQAGRVVASPPTNTITLLLRRPVQAVAIAVVLAIAAGAFVYVGGWLTPNRLSSARFVDRLEASAGGAHPGFRRAHAKGICIAGTFKASPEARSWSKAAVFDGNAIPVTGRLAEATPDPLAGDATQEVRSMALRMQPGAGEEWRTGMNNTPGLAVSTPEAFYKQVVAATPDPATGKPDPAKMQAFLDRHPETVAYRARASAKPLAASFVNDSYNGINGFIFVGPDGQRRLVRWMMRAEAPFSSLTNDERAKAPTNYVFDDLLKQVAAGPLKWHLIATFANPGDPNHAAELWPDDRPQAEMGELVITHVESEAPGNCRDIVFDPLVLPPGIEASDDPIPFARSAVYSASFRRRMGETKPPSAISDRVAGAPQ
jgi:catalase